MTPEPTEAQCSYCDVKEPSKGHRRTCPLYDGKDAFFLVTDGSITAAHITPGTITASRISIGPLPPSTGSGIAIGRPGTFPTGGTWSTFGGTFTFPEEA